MFSAEYWRGVKVFVVAGTLLGAALWDGRRGGRSFAELGAWPKGSRKTWNKNHKLAKGTSVRVYDYGDKAADRYTVIMVGKDWDASVNPGNKMVLNMSEGGRAISMWGEAKEGKHLGKRVKWEDLSPETRRHIEQRVLSD